MRYVHNWVFFKCDFNRISFCTGDFDMINVLSLEVNALTH